MNSQSYVEVIRIYLMIHRLKLNLCEDTMAMIKHFLKQVCVNQWGMVNYLTVVYISTLLELSLEIKEQFYSR